MTGLQDVLLEQKQQNEPYNQPIYGILGIPLGGERRVEVPQRNSYVYVRLRSNLSEVIQAFNNQVAVAYNLPVIVKREGGRYAVVGVDTQRYENNWNSFAPFLPRHANTHSFDTESGGGGDVVWVHPRQFMPALVIPSGSSGAGNVIISPYTLQKSNGSWVYTGNTGTLSFLPYRPTSATGAIIALIYLDSLTGNPGYIINSGTVFSNTITGSNQIIPYLPILTGTSQIPLAAIRLITGTSAISWDNIYDLRQFIHPMPTGTGGGGGGDSTYLRLDTANDPLTNTLQISISGLGGWEVAQLGVGSGTVASPATLITRRDNGQYVNFSGAAIRIEDTKNNGSTVFGPVLSYVWSSQVALTLDPSDHYFLGTTYTINNANPILEISNFGSTKLTVYGNGTVNIPTGSTYNIGSSPHTHNFMLIFATYNAVAPFTLDGQTSGVAAVDRTVTFVKLTHTFFVNGTNNGSNYWTITLKKLSDDGTIKQLNTSGASGSTWSQVSTTSFDIASVGTTQKGIYVSLGKVGAPGNLFIAQPVLEVTA